MKFIIIAVLAVVGLGVLVLSSTRNGSTQTSNKSESLSYPKSELTYSQIKDDLNGGAVLIDVRTPEEFGGGHIEEAELLPLTSIQSGSLPNVSKDQKVYVYCRSGNRSAQAMNILKTAGYTNVVDLGAITEVQKIGGTVVKG